MCNGFASLVLKTRCVWFGGLGLKTINSGFDRFRDQDRGDKLDHTWHYHEVYVKANRSCEGSKFV